MKTLRAVAIWSVVLACILWTMISCTVTTTTTRTTDAKGHVVEVVTVTKSADPAALQLAGTVATAYAPRGIVVREEKAATPSDLRRILHGRPITKQEIAHRWKPAAP
jgi:hypothetical protein